MKLSSRSEINPDTEAKIDSMLPEGMVKKLKQAQLSAFKGGKIICEMCGKDGDDTNFHVCAGCKQALDRRVYYCSRLVKKPMVVYFID